ncbi:DUF4224 domain-containing protein [Chromobacterium vaccinii]|uniref:DUF4224 domain-containing protein n=1 Tax=Chromobacterium vaccinii TaxID=1108595 RepID=UPI003C76EEDD
MDDSILTYDELRDLSGYRTSPRICEWLRANKIPHLTNGRGRPLVSRLVIRTALGETQLPQAARAERSINFNKLNEARQKNNGTAQKN